MFLHLPKCRDDRIPRPRQYTHGKKEILIKLTCPSSSLSSLAGCCGGFGLGDGAGASFCSKLTSSGEDMATVGGAGDAGAAGAG